MMAANTSLLFLLSINDAPRDVVVNFLQLEKNIPAQTNQTAQNPDLHFINQQGTALTIEDVRHLNQDILLRPYQSAMSTFVIFEIDRASIPAQNALLKSLEEPPHHTQIILTTTKVENVLATIQSRCILKRNTYLGETTPHPATLIEIQSIFESAIKGPYTNVFQISEKYKDRAEAQQFLQTLIEFFHQRNQQKPQVAYVRGLQIAIGTQDFLEKNVHVRLALEDLFFRLRAIFMHTPSSSPSHLTENRL